MMRSAPTALILAVAVAGATAALEAQSFLGGAAVTIPSGEVREGDLYTGAESVRVDGRLAGDLLAATNRVVVDGRIDGDVFAVANSIDLRGPVGDSTRVAGQTVTVATTIDGGLLAAAAQLVVTDDARIAGGLHAAAARVEIDGTVGGAARVAAGEIVVRGTIEGDASLFGDHVELAPGARITGDLHYRARTPLGPEAGAQVAGVVRYEAPPDDEDEGGAPWGWLLWFWQMLSALLAGILVIALFRGGVQRLVGFIAGETTRIALAGFAAFLLVPGAAVIAMATLVGLPIGIAAMLLFGVAVYAAKLPFAAWAGGRLLGMAGRPAASPYAGMALGVLLLYLLFAVPYVGWLFWLGATWLGLGAVAISTCRRLGLGAAGA